MPPRRGAGQPYRRLGKNGNTSYGGPRKGNQPIASSSLLATERTSASEKFEANRLANSIDESMGFPRFDSGPKRAGWLVNMHSTTIEDESVPGGRAGVDFYFLGEEEGDTFKATVEYEPYFLIAVKRGREAEVEEWVKRTAEGVVRRISRVEKEDLQMPNHLVGYRRTLLQLHFANVSDLLAVRKVVLPVAEKNKKNMNAMDTYAEVARYVWFFMRGDTMN
jgi:DNA polymerase epsilon subunit 1